MRVTIDTSVFLGLIKQNVSGELQVFFNLATTGHHQFFASTLVEAEIEQFRQVQKYREICAVYTVREIEAYNNQLLCSFREFGPSETAMLWKIRKILAPNRNPAVYQYGNHGNDADHLFAHWLSNNDVFVSVDNGFLKRKSNFLDIGISVAHPIEIT